MYGYAIRSLDDLGFHGVIRPLAGVWISGELVTRRSMRLCGSMGTPPPVGPAQLASRVQGNSPATRSAQACGH